jgi:hypothetical protein
MSLEEPDGTEPYKTQLFKKFSSFHGTQTYYSIHNRPPVDSTLSYTNPVHDLITYLPKVQSKVLQSMPADLATSLPVLLTKGINQSEWEAH